jgi:hypothetical protein
MNIFTSLRVFSDRLNAPWRIYSVNGSGCDGESKTAAYPRNDILSELASPSKLISNVVGLVLRSTVFKIAPIVFTKFYFGIKKPPANRGLSSSLRNQLVRLLPVSDVDVDVPTNIKIVGLNVAVVPVTNQQGFF